jgi:hypothetical protein
MAQEWRALRPAGGGPSDRSTLSPAPTKEDGTMGLRDSLSKGAEAARAQVEQRAQDRAERSAVDTARVASLPKWEYQVKRIGEDKQKGLLGSQRMEQIFNDEGAKGWELVAINEERATFKRQLA